MKKWKLTLMMGLICGLLIAGNALAEYNADFMPYHYYTVGQGNVLTPRQESSDAYAYKWTFDNDEATVLCNTKEIYTGDNSLTAQHHGRALIPWVSKDGGSSREKIERWELRNTAEKGVRMAIESPYDVLQTVDNLAFDQSVTLSINSGASAGDPAKEVIYLWTIYDDGPVDNPYDRAKELGDVLTSGSSLTLTNDNENLASHKISVCCSVGYKADGEGFDADSLEISNKWFNVTMAPAAENAVIAVPEEITEVPAAVTAVHQVSTTGELETLMTNMAVENVGSCQRCKRDRNCIA